MALRFTSSHSSEEQAKKSTQDQQVRRFLQRLRKIRDRIPKAGLLPEAGQEGIQRHIPQAAVEVIQQEAAIEAEQRVQRNDQRNALMGLFSNTMPIIQALKDSAFPLHKATGNLNKNDALNNIELNKVIDEINREKLSEANTLITLFNQEQEKKQLPSNPEEFDVFCKKMLETLENLCERLRNGELASFNIDTTEIYTAINHQVENIRRQLERYQKSISIDATEDDTLPDLEQDENRDEYKKLSDFLKHDANQRIVSVLGGPASPIVDDINQRDNYVHAMQAIAMFPLQKPSAETEAQTEKEKAAVIALQKKNFNLEWMDLDRQIREALINSSRTKFANDLHKHYKNLWTQHSKANHPNQSKAFSSAFDAATRDEDWSNLINDISSACIPLYPKNAAKDRKLFRLAFLQRKENIRHWPEISSVNELLIAQQKRDAIELLAGQMKNLTREGSNPEIQAKYYAYRQLIIGIMKSQATVPLSALIADDSPLFNQPVKRPINENDKQNTLWVECTLPGRPYATVKEVLSHQRIFGQAVLSHQRIFGQATSKKILNKLRRQAQLTDPVMIELARETETLQQLLAAEPDANVFQVGNNQLYLVMPSKNFRNERRVFEIDTTIFSLGGQGTFYPNVTHVWKIDSKNRVISHQDISGRMGAKQALEEKQESFKREIQLTQNWVPSAKMKDPQSGPESMIALMALRKGQSLDSILKRQKLIQIEIAKLKQEGQDQALIAELEKKLLTKKQRIQIGLEILRDVQRLHDTGLVHFDVKPDNVIIDTSNRDDSKAKFIDFGFSRRKGDVTKVNDGTWGYAHPIALTSNQNKQKVDLKYDSYSLKVMLAELLIGSKAKYPKNQPSLFHKTYKQNGKEKILNNHFNNLINASQVDKEKVLAQDLLKEVLKPLYDYYQNKHVDDENQVENYIEAFEVALKEIELQEKGILAPDKNQIKEAFRPMNSARTALRDMQKASKKEKSSSSHCDTIKTIIETSLEKVGDDEASLQDYLTILGIQALKDLYLNRPKAARIGDSAYSDHPDPLTKEKILKRVDEIIVDYKAYKDYANILTKLKFENKQDRKQAKRIAKKIRDRYKRYQREINITSMTLDGMEERNQSNQKDLAPYLERIHDHLEFTRWLALPKNESSKTEPQALPTDHPQPVINLDPGLIGHAPELIGNDPELIDNDHHEDTLVPPVKQEQNVNFQAIVSEISNLPLFHKLGVTLDPNPGSDPLNFKAIAEAMAKQLNKSRSASKLLPSNQFGNSYKLNLIYRAITQLDDWLKIPPQGPQGKPVSFESLEQLLNYQQKREVLIELEKRLITIPTGTKKHDVYQGLIKLITNNIDDHSKSVYDIIGINRKKHFNNFFLSKLDHTHFFSNSGDLYAKLCDLDRPNVFLAEMKEQSKHGPNWEVKNN